MEWDGFMEVTQRIEITESSPEGRLQRKRGTREADAMPLLGVRTGHTGDNNSVQALLHGSAVAPETIFVTDRDFSGTGE